jgi:phage-related minor tail protein
MGRAPHAALAYATARQAMETDAIARPHLTTTPFAATLWETTKRALSSFLRTIRIHQG